MSKLEKARRRILAAAVTAGIAATSASAIALPKGGPAYDRLYYGQTVCVPVPVNCVYIVFDNSFQVSEGVVNQPVGF